jgi:alpha-L-rhamnosidase
MLLSCGEQPLATPTPTISWLPSAQSAYEIEVRVNGGEPRRHRGQGSEPRVPWPWEPLPSRARLAVRVRVAEGEEWSAWSEPLQVRTALWYEEDWAGHWISPRETGRGVWELRTDVELADVRSEAWLYATALGVYDVAINGLRVGDVELAPGFTSYDKTLYAQAYEVTDLLRPGRNTIAFTVSDGWYRGHVGGTQRRDTWGGTLGIRAQVEVGGTVVAATGPGWIARASQITRADLMRGQTTDFRLRPGSGTSVLVDAVTAPTPRWSPAPPVRRVEEWPPASVTPLRPGVSIVDAGQNISGRLRLRNLGAPGRQITLEYGEHLDADGDLTTAHLDTRTPGGDHIVFSQADEVIAGTGEEVFEPRHTVHGFRYIRVTHPGRTLSADDLTVVAVHSDLVRRGWFSCSDPDLERLHQAADWSFRGNAVDIPTDCPTRERSGWTGDWGLFAPVAAMLYDIEGFSRKWLRSVRDDQCDDGLPAMFSPDSERLKVHPDNPARIGGGSAGWGDALVDVPWTLYQEYGDPQILAESWESMRAWVAYALRSAREFQHACRTGNNDYVWDGPFHFGEWCEPRRPGDPPLSLAQLMSHDQGELATAYLYRTLTRMSAIAGVLGRPDEFAETAGRVLAAWRAEFLDPVTGRTAADSQAGYVRALSFGLLPEELTGAAADRLAELVRKNDDRLTTGFLASGLLLPALADHGHADLAYTLLLRRGTPSWLGMLDRGATTIWEEWEGVDDQGEAQASLNHYGKGAVIQFLHGHVAGLRQHPASAGWERFTVRPVPGGGVTSARLRHLTPRGPIEVGWTLDGSRFELDVEVPPTATAEITLPDGRLCTRGAGHHRFTA